MKKSFLLLSFVIAALACASNAKAAIVFGPGGIDGANGKTLAQTYAAFANAAGDHSGDVNMPPLSLTYTIDWESGENTGSA